MWNILHSVTVGSANNSSWKDTGFGVIFQDNSQNILSEVSYSFKVTEAGGKVIADLHDQKAPDGTGISPCMMVILCFFVFSIFWRQIFRWFVKVYVQSIRPVNLHLP